MKKCLVTCIVLALSGSAASASVTTDFLFDGEAKGFNSWQMVTDTTTDWTNARLEVSLSEGAFIYDYSIPDDYDYSIPDDILEHPELVSQFRPATTGLIPGLGKMVVAEIKTDPQDFVLSWGDTANLGAGNWQIGLLTFTANANGTIWGKSYDRDTQGVGVQFTFDIVNGQITPAELPVTSLPFITDPVVTETTVVTPDPEVTETPVVTPDLDDTPRLVIGYHPMIEVIDISIHGVIIRENFIKLSEERIWHDAIVSSRGLTTYSLASVGGGEQAAIDIVPEPASAALLLLGVSTLLRRRKMR